MNQTDNNHEELCYAPNQEQNQPQPQLQQISRPRGQSVSNYPPQIMNQLPPWMFPMNQNVPVPFTNIMTAPKFTWRKGKWSEEEEMYTKKLIDAFNSGCLKIASGTTLRSFLAERLFWYVLMHLILFYLLKFLPLMYSYNFLCSDPMRITKKFAGSSCTGKQVFGKCLMFVPIYFNHVFI